MLAMTTKRVLPGFGLSLGGSVLFVCLILLLPLSALVMQLAQMSWSQYWEVITGPELLTAYKITLICAGVASLFNAIFGMLMAWILTRYRFPGRALLDGLMDLPFALPTAVAGLTLATLFSTTGWYGGWLAQFGIKVSYTWLGIAVAMPLLASRSWCAPCSRCSKSSGRNMKKRPKPWARGTGRRFAASFCRRSRRRCWREPHCRLPAAWVNLAW